MAFADISNKSLMLIDEKDNSLLYGNMENLCLHIMCLAERIHMESWGFGELCFQMSFKGGGETLDLNIVSVMHELRPYVL